tara:strand:+ start:2181 stop:2396 length:216 start_codon:yes stop_codon:yes gene_type:complete
MEVPHDIGMHGVGTIAAQGSDLIAATILCHRVGSSDLDSDLGIAAVVAQGRLCGYRSIPSFNDASPAFAAL